MSILKSIATQQKKYMYNKIKSIMQAIMVLLWKDWLYLWPLLFFKIKLFADFKN